MSEGIDQASAATSSEAPSGRWKLYASRILAGLGVLQAYNLVSHAQNVVSLSQTVQIVAAWWHYFTSLPFKLIQFRATPLEIDLMMISLFAISAVSASHFRKTKRIMLVDLSKNDGSFLEKDSSWIDVLVHVALGMAILFPVFRATIRTFIYYSGAQPVIVKWVSVGIAVVLLILVGWEILADKKYGVMKINRLFGELVNSLIENPKVVARACGWVVVLLLLSVLFRHVVDPYVLPYLSKLPTPPGFK
jgi:hypothetical protein